MCGLNISYLPRKDDDMQMNLWWRWMPNEVLVTNDVENFAVQGIVYWKKSSSNLWMNSEIFILHAEQKTFKWM